MSLYAPAAGFGGSGSAPSGPGAPVRLRQSSRLFHYATSFLAAVGIVTVASLLLMGMMEKSTRAPAPAPAYKSDWIAYNKPVQMFALQTSEFGKDARLYEGRRHRAGGGRQDMLAYGAAELGPLPGLRISLYRVGEETAPETAFIVDIARQAAGAGFSVIRGAQPDALATRFGTFEVADMIFRHGEQEAGCLGFRLNAGAPDLRVSGFACGGARPLDRPSLACALDRLDLISAGDDKELSRFFIAAEQGRRNGCAAPRGPGVKATWLDHGANLPPLRNLTTARNVAAR